VHILEPSLAYTYIPDVDQSTIPFFDSLDSIPHTSSIRYALTNRLSGLNSTYLEARFRLSQSYSLLNVEKNFSPLLAEATLASKNVDVNLNVSYDVHDKNFAETIGSARLKNSTGYIGIGKNFRRATSLDQLTFEGGLYSPIRLRGKAIPIGINGIIWYDLNGNGVQEMTISSTYTHQCWGLTITFNRDSEDYQILFAIELKGLTTFGLGSTDSLQSNTSY
jgi:LPS-assembly protein